MTQDMIDLSRKRHTLTERAFAALIAALVTALTVAAVTVSIGIARADTLGDGARQTTDRCAPAALRASAIR